MSKEQQTAFNGRRKRWRAVCHNCKKVLGDPNGYNTPSQAEVVAELHLNAPGARLHDVGVQ